MHNYNYDEKHFKVMNYAYLQLCIEHSRVYDLHMIIVLNEKRI